MYAYFNRFMLNISPEDAHSGSHQGDCTADVQALADTPYIARQLDTISADDIRAELAEYGAWDDDQLADDQSNRERIVWIACGNVVEDMHEKNYGKDVR